MTSVPIKAERSVALSLAARVNPAMRDAGLDGLRLLMAVFVVGLHVDLLRDVSSDWANVFRNGIFRIGVPTFFVLNGYFLNLANGPAVWRFASRVLLLFVVWTAIYSPFWIPHVDWSVGSIVRLIVRGHQHLWYLSALVPAIALAYVCRTLTSRQRIALATFLLFIGWILQLTAMQSAVRWDYFYFRNALLFGLPFILIGTVLRTLDVRSVRWVAGFAGVASVLFVGEIALMRLLTGNANQDILFSLLLIAPACVLVARQLQFRARSGILADASTVIYLAHPLFYETLALDHATEFVATMLLCFAALPVLLVLRRWVPVI